MAKLLGTEVSGHRIDRYWLHTGDDGKDRITVETIEDMEPILEANKRDMNDAPGRFEKKPDVRRVARIPGVTIMEMCRLNKIGFRELMLAKSDRAKQIWDRFLNDSTLRGFRTSPGRVVMGAKR